MRFAAGVALGFAALALPAELLLRLSPPDELLPYLGANSPLSGPYVADTTLGADYRSFADFQGLYGDRLAELEAQRLGRPVWAMFGNSFVQAPGMLGDTAQAAMPDTQIFYLRRNEPLYLRVAQFRLLLAEGLAPRHAFFVVVPVDLYGIAQEPVASVAVTPGGAIGRDVRRPPWLAPFLDGSRLALAAWVRSGRQRLLPDFRPADVMRPPPPLIAAELDRLLGEVGRIAKVHEVPTTVVVLPNREQIMGDPTTAPQDAFSTAARKAGLDVLDTSAAFRDQPDKAGLLVPDGHLSPRGNALLLDAIRAHLGEAAR